MKKELISIIIPVYNVREYLKTAIMSMINQTYKELEIILVDDGSTDGSGELCEQFAEQDQRIKVIHKKNGGLSDARNAGIKSATGEYLAFLDSDDWVDNRFIEYLYKTITIHKADIAQVKYLVLPEEIHIEENLCNIREQLFGKESFDSAEFNQIINEEGVVVWNKLYRKSLFSNIMFPKGCYHEDNYVTYKLFYESKKVVFTEAYLYFYRYRKTGIMGKNPEERFSSAINAYKEKEEYLIEKGYKNAYRMHIEKYRALLNKYLTYCSMNANNLISKTVIEENSRIKRLEFVTNDSKEKKSTTTMEYKLPVAEIANRKKIIVYGAGNVGRQYIKQIKDCNGLELIACVDMNWYRVENDIAEIHPISEIFKKSYDCIVIAINNESISNQAIEMLTNFGVDTKKIIWSI